MEILAIIGIIAIIGLLFTGGGLLGWVIKGFEAVLSFLWEGNAHIIGCFLKFILALFALGVFFALL